MVEFYVPSQLLGPCLCCEYIHHGIMFNHIMWEIAFIDLSLHTRGRDKSQLTLAFEGMPCDNDTLGAMGL